MPATAAFNKKIFQVVTHWSTRTLPVQNRFQVETAVIQAMIPGGTLQTGDYFRITIYGAVDSISAQGNADFWLRWGEAGVGPILWSVTNVSPEISDQQQRIICVVQSPTSIRSVGTWWNWEGGGDPLIYFADVTTATVDTSVDTNITVGLRTPQSEFWFLAGGRFELYRPVPDNIHGPPSTTGL